MARFSMDSNSRRLGRNVVVGGSPLRIVRLTNAGADVLDAIVAGGPLPATHHSLTSRLAAIGVIHPMKDDAAPARYTPADVTVVIPAFNRLPTAAIAAAEEADVSGVIVVDDASPIPLEFRSGQRAEIVRRHTNAGPGATRNAGLELVTTPLVAFVDADVIPTSGWLDALLWHFDDDQVGLVAPRVHSRSGTALLQRYERWRSPLDLGDQPARITPGGRVSYVPGATVVLLTAAVRQIGGFDEGLRFGEDVDLVWRLDEGGWIGRYEPLSTVTHEPRATRGQWDGQRFAYGSSAAALDRRHPGALAPARTSRWSAAIWGLIAVGQPLAAGVIGIGTVIALARRLRQLPEPVRESIRLAGKGNLFSARIFAAAITRAWWPIALLAALTSQRARRVVVAAAVVPALLDWWRDRPELDLVAAVAIRLADDVSYGAGLWRGVWRERRLGPLKPAFPETGGMPSSRTPNSA